MRLFGQRNGLLSGQPVIIPRNRIAATGQGVKYLANIKSAKKRVGITAKQNLRNRMVSSAVKTSMKRYDQALEAGDAAAAEAAYIKAVSTVDKAAGKGVIHKNAANRKKAQLAVKRTAAAN